MGDLSAFMSASLVLSGSHMSTETDRNNTCLYVCLLICHFLSCVQSGGAAFLLGLPTLSWLGSEAYHRVQSSAVVLALEKGSRQPALNVRYHSFTDFGTQRIPHA